MAAQRAAGGRGHRPGGGAQQPLQVLGLPGGSHQGAGGQSSYTPYIHDIRCWDGVGMYGCIRDESLKDEILPIIITKFSIPTLFSCAPSHHQTLLSNLTTLLKFCFPKAEAENREVLQNEYNELGNILSKVDMPSYETFVNIYSKILVNSFSLRSDRLVHCACSQ